MLAAVARTRNKGYYRVLHVPIWVWVMFSLPGPLTYQLYAHGPNRDHGIWLAVSVALCAWCGWRGQLPGAEPRPYITHYGLDWPNLPYRVVCYTGAWIAMLVPTGLNLAGLVYAAATGEWVLGRLYDYPYLAGALLVIVATICNLAPRAKRSIRNEGVERGWFYVVVWIAVPTQAAAWAMWRLGSRLGWDAQALVRARLAVFVAVALLMLVLGVMEKLPRTHRYRIEGGAGELRAAAGE